MSRPVIRGCRVSSHAGAAIAWGGGAGGLVINCDISRCGCGIWLDCGADPLIWRNTISVHRGAGVVIRADGRGRVVGNSVLRNGAGGFLIESSRRTNSVVAQNRVWANSGGDLRQSPASPGRGAFEAGLLLLSNSLGECSSGSRDPQKIQVSSAWPKRTVSTPAELVTAVYEAPKDHFVVVEVAGLLQLQEPLTIDRPVVIAGADTGRPELRGSPNCEAVVVVAAGGEEAAFWRLALTHPHARRARTGSCCVEVTAGKPVFLECDFDAMGSNGSAAAAGVGRWEQAAVMTHAFRVNGHGVEPLLVGCTLRGATGSGITLDEGASASLLQCEISDHEQGGIFVGSSAYLELESCDVCRNGHFGITLGPHARSAFLGRASLFSNVAGSVWHCGGQTRLQDQNASSGKGSLGVSASTWPTQLPLWLDQCSLAGAGASRGRVATPAIVVGAGAAALMWDSDLAQLPYGESALRAEERSHVVVACDGFPPGHANAYKRASNVAWIDVSGAAPMPALGQSGMQPQSLGLLFPHGREGMYSQNKVSAKSPAVTIAPVEEAPSATNGAVEATENSALGGEPGLQPEESNTFGSSTLDASTFVSEPPAEADRFRDWLHAKWDPSGNDAFQGNEQNRRMLYQILAMQAGKDKCTDILDRVGLAGVIKPGDVVLLRGHTGCWFALKGTEVLCDKKERDVATDFIVEAKTDALRHSGVVTFQAASDDTLRLGVNANAEVRALKVGHGVREADTQFSVQLDSPGTVMSGMRIYLKSVGVSKMVEVEGKNVRARTHDKGTIQRITIEKLPPDSDVPDPCPDFELDIQEKAWLYRRGVEFALVDKQQLAAFLAGHKDGRKELLRAYTQLWEAEWRRDWALLMREAPDNDDSSNASPHSRQSSSQSPAPGMGRTPSKSPGRSRASTRDWIYEVFTGVSGDDKTNGDMIVSALRSFFATALRMSQLEANPVQRVIEAFADALVNDKAFLASFTPSMLPAKDRKQYKNPEDVIFGLTYTVMMLNTDMHNKQVASKMFDAKKFAGAGKECGVTPGLMLQIYKNVQKEEL